MHQLAVLLRNNVGELADVLRHLERESVKLHAISITDSVDCAVVRLVVDRTETARQVLSKAGFASIESSLLAVEFPDEECGLLGICRALIQAEINIHYAYAMFSRPHGRAVVLVHVESPSTAAEVLRRRGFCLIDDEDIGDLSE
ncbi:MAG: acetolactate synthase [Planctomycetota bacterium]